MQKIIIIFKNLALIRQFIILDYKFLFISLRRLLINTNIILLTNNN